MKKIMYFCPINKTTKIKQKWLTKLIPIFAPLVAHAKVNALKKLFLKVLRIPSTLISASNVAHALTYAPAKLSAWSNLKKF